MENKIYLNYTAVEQHVHEIIRQITADNFRPDYIVGLTRGGLLPANLISQYLNVKMYTLDVSLRDNTSDIGPESNCWMAEDALNGVNILIVDDINDSGATLQWIVDDWKSSNNPHSPEWETVFTGNVRIATLVNNEASAFRDVSYRGVEINKAEDNVWIQFPWELFWKPKN